MGGRYLHRWSCWCACTFLLVGFVRLDAAPETNVEVEGPDPLLLSKPGQCPQVDKEFLYSDKECQEAVSDCNSDADCFGSQKCCNNGCAKMCTRSLQTGCLQLQSLFERQSRALEEEPWGDLYIPKCREGDGQFENIQCNNAQNNCWCVDNQGLELAGTRARALTSVNCTSPNKCASYLCRMLCPYGFELDPDGCPLCECRNPCKGVSCPAGQECLIEESPCSDPICPPLPTCKRPRKLSHQCPFGEPLVSPDTNNPFLCGLVPNKPQCPLNYLCNVLNGSDYGVCCPLHEKPGECPKEEMEGGCGVPCEMDMHCDGTSKCCDSPTCGRSCMKPGNLTLCQQQKQVVELLIRGNPNYEAYVPQCDTNGEFFPRQCTANGRLCWCVDEKGVQIRGTLGPAGSVQCATESRDSQSSAPCSSSQCNLNCSLGFKTDDSGCQLCECYDPCKEISCPEDAKCVVMKEDPCGSGHCPPIATCMRKNRPTCGQGSPLTNPGTGDAVQCSGQDGCPVTHKCQLLPEQDNGICCPLLESFATENAAGEPSEKLSCPNSILSPSSCENGTCSSDQDCSAGMKCCHSEACGLVCVSPKPTRLPTMCEYLREMGMKLESSGEKPSLAVPIPSCRPDGSYEPIQCDPLSSECWCVDEFGSELRNTRAQKGNVDCREVRALRNCLGLLCRLGCDYGFEMDEDGCPYCECRNPCTNAICGKGLECQMQSLPCDSYWCPPIPQCIKVRVETRANIPQCPVGRPLMFEENDRPVTCSPLQTYQQCPDTHMCVAEDLDGPGICCPRIVINEENTNEASETREEEHMFSQEKAGQCPYLVPVRTDSCDFNCQADSDCPESHKCCSNGCGTQCTAPQLLTACQHQRQILDLRAREKGVPASQTHLPVCTPDGSFEATQCDPASSTCWCVDENGWEVPGTRSPSSQTINCTNPVKCYPTDCDLACIHGLEVGADGCYACSCRDPCKDLKCNGPKEECRSVQVNCVSSPCPPVALCLPSVENPCPWGEPLVNLSSGLAQECGPSQGSCPSSHKCHLSPMGEYAVCCPKPREVCYQELDVGLCKAAIPRWFFNRRINACEQFTFGGCGGNLNNFHSKEDCMATCPVMSHCERIRERNLKIKKTMNKIVFLPKCNRQTGTWEPVQCLDSLGLCWCVDKEGDQISGSVIRGTPTCTARAARNMADVSICPGNQAVYMCPEDMCAHAACVAYSNATCRINPCDGCKVEFFDEKNRKVQCRKGLTACLDEVQQVVESPAWINQAKSSRKVNIQFADSSESEVLDDGSIPLPPSYLPPPPPPPPTMAFALRQGILERVEESVHHETAIIAQEMTQDNTPSGGVSSHITIVMTPRFKGFSIRIPNFFSPLRRMVGDIVPDEIEQVLATTKPGACPTPSMWSLLRSMSWRCDHQCLSDGQCPGNQKCCVGQCGLECVVPDSISQFEEKEHTTDHIGLESNEAFDGPMVMMAVSPNCSSEGGYAIVQRQGELSWCVDKYGRPHHETLTRGTVRCSRNGTITFREELGPVCRDSGVLPKMCRKQCLGAYCPQHPEAVCVADPCQDCAISFVNSQGEKVECEDKCLQPVEVGQCGGAVQRFHFSQATQRCQSFTFSGCQGNDNNFQSLDECQASCEQPKPMCEQLKDVGLCRARIPRWFFNKHTHSCEEFMYGGCGGNDNNFASKQECLARCPDVVFCPTAVLTSELKGCSRSILCANVSCPGNAEAVCTVDPCLCKAVFVDAKSGNTVECQPPHQEPDVTIPLITSDTRCQHLRSKNSIEHTSASSYMAQCTREGHFEPTQCATDLDSNKEECWCVDEVGIQLPDSDTFTRKNAKCRTVRIQRVEVTIAYVPENSPVSVNEKQVMSLTRRLLNRLATTPDDNMEVESEISPQVTKVKFSLSDKNKLDATFKLEQMVKTGGLMLQLADGRLVADYRSSHFYHISDYVPQDVEVFDNVIRETHMAINAATVARDNTITLVAAMLVITVVIVLLLLAAVMVHRRKNMGDSSNSLVSLAFSSPIYGFITRKSQTKTNPYDSVKKKPEAAIQTVESEYESIQNQINKEKEPDSPPPSYKSIDETKNPEKV